MFAGCISLLTPDSVVKRIVSSWGLYSKFADTLIASVERINSFSADKQGGAIDILTALFECVQNRSIGIIPMLSQGDVDTWNATVQKLIKFATGADGTKPHWQYQLYAAAMLWVMTRDRSAPSVSARFENAHLPDALYDFFASLACDSDVLPLRLCGAMGYLSLHGGAREQRARIASSHICKSRRKQRVC